MATAVQLWLRALNPHVIYAALFKQAGEKALLTLSMCSAKH